jgi:hypothetical protein
MHVLGDADPETWKQWWDALRWLVIAAAVAFAVGLFVRFRRSRIQRRYQERMRQDAEDGKGPVQDK